MASVTTDTSLSAVSYTAGETITVSNNAVLTIDATPATQPGTISVTDVRGTIFLSNSSTTTPIVLTLNGFANDLTFTGNGLLKSRGRWINIGTGDGTASQTLDFNTCVGGVAIDRPMCVLVERERLGDNTSNFTLSSIGVSEDTGRSIWRVTRNSGTDWAIADSRTKAGNWKMHCVGHITMAGWANSANNDIFNVHDYDTNGTWIEFEAPHHATPVAESSVTSVTIKTARVFYHVGGSADTAEVALTEYYPNWEAGRVFAYDSSTKVATFGNGTTGGVVIPNGSNVYYPNIHLTSATSNSTITSRSLLNANVSGYLDIDVLAMSERISLTSLVNLSQLSIRNMFYGASSSSRILQSSNLATVVVNGFYGGLDSTFGARASGAAGGGMSAVVCKKIFIKNHGVCFRNDTNATTPIELVNTSDVNGFNFELVSFRNAVATTYFMVSICSNVAIRNVSSVGTYLLIQDSENIYLENVRISSNIGTTDANVTMCTITSTVNLVVNGYYSIPNLGKSLSFVVNAPLSNSDIVFHHGEIDLPSSNAIRPLTLLGSRQACAFLDLTDITSCPSISPTASSTTKQIRFAKISTNTQKNMTYCSGLSIDGVSTSGFTSTTNNAASVDSPGFYLMYTSSAMTAALLQIGLFATESTLEYFNVVSGTLDGDVYYNNKGYLYLEADGNQIVQTSDLIGGITSFKNVAPAISGTSTGTLTFDYAISEDKETWGSYQTLNATNLIAETLPNFQDGFYMRIRITASGADLTRYVSRIILEANTDASYQPIIDTRVASFSGLIASSAVGVFDGVNLIASGIADVDGLLDLNIPCLFDNVPVVYDFIARKAGYQEVTGQFTMNHKDVSTSISQTLDRTVGSGSVNVTVNGSTEEISSTGTGLDVLDVYDTVQLWSELEENIIYDIPIVKVTDSQYSLAAGWEHLVTGEVASLTLELSGTNTVSSGGFFEDTTGAKWEDSGSIYYASHAWIQTVDGLTADPIELAGFGWGDEATQTKLIYDLSLVQVGVETDVNGEAEMYLVYKIDSTVYAQTKLVVGHYDYQFLTIPRQITGEQIGSSATFEINRLNADNQVVLSKAAALAISGITFDHTNKFVDLGDNDLVDSYDHIKAKQAGIADIEAGIPGCMSYCLNGQILSKNGSTFTALSDWSYQNVGNTGKFVEGWIEFDAPGSYARSYESVDFDFSVVGTYDFRDATIIGTVVLTNSSVGSVTVQLHPDHLYTNTGPNITVQASVLVDIAAPNLINGTRVQIYNVTQAAEIDNSLVSGGGGYTYYAEMGTGYEVEDGDIIRLRATYVSGASAAKEELTNSVAISASGITFVDGQTDDDVYIAWAVDGSTITEFSADYPNIQVDINDPDGDTTKRRLGAWLKYIVTTADGIRNFYGASTTNSVADIRINVDTVDLKLDNVSGSEVYFSDNDIRLYRSDLAQIIASGSDSIFLDYSGVPFVTETGTSGLTAGESAKLDLIATVDEKIDDTLKLGEFIALK
jgi:hypothetical protein